MLKVNANFTKDSRLVSLYVHACTGNYTSYFIMLKQVSLYSKQFPIVGCGQISLLMPKTHSTVQRGSNSLFNETHLFILFTRSTEAFSDICMFTRFRFHYLACTLYQLI